MNSPPDPNDPFATLGLEPTLQPARVKRAYFEAVVRTPPYRDAPAFARVRAAYEALIRPGGLEAAYLAAPLALGRELSALRARYAPALAEARQRASARREGDERLPAFLEAAASTPLEAFIAKHASSTGKPDV
jgi:hypothetical protein